MDHQISVGYGVQMDGMKTSPENCNKTDGRYFNHSVTAKKGDIFEMKVDCNNWILSYKLNDKDLGKAFDIQPTEYRAAITLYDYNSSFTLCSYAHIY